MWPVLRNAGELRSSEARVGTMRSADLRYDLETSKWRDGKVVPSSAVSLARTRELFSNRISDLAARSSAMAHAELLASRPDLRVGGFHCEEFTLEVAQVRAVVEAVQGVAAHPVPIEQAWSMFESHRSLSSAVPTAQVSQLFRSIQTELSGWHEAWRPERILATERARQQVVRWLLWPDKYPWKETSSTHWLQRLIRLAERDFQERPPVPPQYRSGMALLASGTASEFERLRLWLSALHKGRSLPVGLPNRSSLLAIAQYDQPRGVRWTRHVILITEGVRYWSGEPNHVGEIFLACLQQAEEAPSGSKLAELLAHYCELLSRELHSSYDKECPRFREDDKVLVFAAKSWRRELRELRKAWKVACAHSDRAAQAYMLPVWEPRRRPWWIRLANGLEHFINPIAAALILGMLAVGDRKPHNDGGTSARSGEMVAKSRARRNPRGDVTAVAQNNLLKAAMLAQSGPIYLYQEGRVSKSAGDGTRAVMSCNIVSPDFDSPDPALEERFGACHFGRECYKTKVPTAMHFDEACITLDLPWGDPSGLIVEIQDVKLAEMVNPPPPARPLDLSGDCHGMEVSFNMRNSSDGVLMAFPGVRGARLSGIDLRSGMGRGSPYGIRPDGEAGYLDARLKVMLPPRTGYVGTARLTRCGTEEVALVTSVYEGHDMVPVENMVQLIPDSHSTK